MSLPPAFCRGQGHRNPVRYATYDSRSRIYLSLDSKCFKMWRVGHELATLDFSGMHDSYISTVIFVPEHSVFLCAALDNTLKVFDQPRKSRVRFLPILASLAWDQSAVTAMAFNGDLDELITAGATGISVWRCEYYEGSAEEHAEAKGGRGPTGPRPRLASPWRFGRGVALRRRLALDVRLPNGRHAASASAPQWVSFIELQQSTQRLFASTAGYIFGYDLATGARLYSWDNLHSQPVTCMLYLPELRYVVTGSSDCTAKIWLLRPGGKLEVQQTVSSPHTKAIIAVKEYVAGAALLTASADGAVMLWSLGTFEPLQRMKVGRRTWGGG